MSLEQTSITGSLMAAVVSAEVIDLTACAKTRQATPIVPSVS
jgi:hypothetical protein